MILWNDDYSVCPSFSAYKDKGASWTLGWQEAGEFAIQEGIEVVWQMNAAVGLVCGPEVAATLAAKFVAAAVAHGSPVNVIEVGNENYGDDDDDDPNDSNPQNTQTLTTDPLLKHFSHWTLT